MQVVVDASHWSEPRHDSPPVEVQLPPGPGRATHVVV